MDERQLWKLADLIYKKCDQTDRETMEMFQAFPNFTPHLYWCQCKNEFIWDILLFILEISPRPIWVLDDFSWLKEHLYDHEDLQDQFYVRLRECDYEAYNGKAMSFPEIVRFFISAKIPFFPTPPQKTAGMYWMPCFCFSNSLERRYYPLISITLSGERPFTTYWIKSKSIQAEPTNSPMKLKRS